jgi:methylenetetrahydrofolate dehydrogenase (NADP+)/methenyltetrahydrofolate cyclohydrolase
MSAHIINGITLSKKIRENIKARAQTLINQNIKPGLAVILVGQNPASQVYVQNKIKACAEQGIYSLFEHYPEDFSEAALLERIAQLNADPHIHGILIQLPLPVHIDSHKVIETIAPTKDVDGFHIANIGALMTGAPLFKPCTPYGCMKMLEEIQAPIRGAHAVIIGASNIVGKPMAMLLLQAGATITVCNSKTRDLSYHTKQADILVVAVGRPNLITGDMIKPGAIVLDVGINRISTGENTSKLCGDVDFQSASQVAGWITPVPGGVGPMTITMLLENTLEAAERSIQI